MQKFQFVGETVPDELYTTVSELYDANNGESSSTSTPGVKSPNLPVEELPLHRTVTREAPERRCFIDSESVSKFERFLDLIRNTEGVDEYIKRVVNKSPFQSKFASILAAVYKKQQSLETFAELLLHLSDNYIHRAVLASGSLESLGAVCKDFTKLLSQDNLNKFLRYLHFFSKLAGSRESSETGQHLFHLKNINE